MYRHTFNTLLFTCGLLFLSPQLFAELTDKTTFHQGFYLGEAIGGSLGHATWKGTSSISGTNDQGTPLSLFHSWTPEGKRSQTNLAGRLMLGYQFTRNPLYLATELGATLSENYHFSANEDKSFSVSTLSRGAIKTLDARAMTNDSVTLHGTEITVDLKTGRIFNDRLLGFFRLGMAVNQASIKNNGVWHNISTSYPPYDIPYDLMVEDSSSKNKTVLGLRLGLGLEYPITPELGISVDYIYTQYGTISTLADASGTSFPAFIINPNLSPYYSINGVDQPEVSLSSQSLMLGLLYHFH